MDSAIELDFSLVSHEKQIERTKKLGNLEYNNDENNKKKNIKIDLEKKSISTRKLLL